MKADNSIHFACKSLIMGCNEGRSPLPTHQIEELRKNDIGRAFVEVPGRLIRQNKLGPVRKSPRDGNPLLFPA